MKAAETVTLECFWDEGADTSLGLPRYETTGAAGADVRANFSHRGAIILAPGERTLVPTGLRVAVPDGFELQLRPRSGLARIRNTAPPNAAGSAARMSRAAAAR